MGKKKSLNYQKFLSDIKKINFAPQLKKSVEDVLTSAVLRERELEFIALSEKINQLPTAQDSADRELIEAQKNKLLTQLTDLKQIIVTLKNKLPENHQHVSTIKLSQDFIHEFSKAFRNIEHLQRTLLNAPQIIRDYETAFTLALLSNLNEQELQIQLETLNIHQLQHIISDAAMTYDRDNDNADPILRNGAQNLAHLAAMIIIKRQCADTQSRKNETPETTYINLLHTVTNMIPEVGSSTIFDTISNSQIQLDPQNANSGKVSVAALLDQTRRKLGLNNLAWNDTAQMKPSRALFQKLRFGQEDRRVYVEMRRKNLKNDLLMARNIYDIKQFTQDKISDTAFQTIEKERFDNAIWNNIYATQDQANRDLNFYQLYYNQYEKVPFTYPTQDGTKKTTRVLENKYKQTDEYKKGRVRGGDISQLPDLKLREEKRWENATLAKLEHYREFKDNLEAQKATSQNETKRLHTKKTILNDSNAMYSLEKIFSTMDNNTTNLLCSEPFAFVNPDTGDITVTLYGFRLSDKQINTAQAYPGMNIETKVTKFISEHGGTSVRHGTFTGKNIQEIKRKIAEQFSGELDIKDRFSAAVETLQAGVPKPRNSIDQLGLSENQDNARLRAILELREFFKHYRGYLVQNHLETHAIDSQAKKLHSLFAQIDNGEYENAIQSKHIDTLSGEAYAWISKLPAGGMPSECLKTYAKAAKIALSSYQKQVAAQKFDAAMDPKHSSEEQITALATVFRDEYDSEMAKEALGVQQSQQALADIDTMAREYVHFATETEKGHFSIQPSQEDTYIQALAEISNQIQNQSASLGDLQKVKFKLSHKIKPGIRTPITITGETGKTYTAHITISDNLPYSLVKGSESNNLSLSYGGSRGVVAQLPLTEKQRYFTSWRIYGVGQYGTVKRMDDLISGEGLVNKEGLIATRDQSTYQTELQQDPLYRALTSRDDPNSGTERTVLEAIRDAKITNDSTETNKTQYWRFQGKSKKMHTAGISAERYNMLQPLAKGKSYKDETDDHLNNTGKGTLEFHRPNDTPENRENNLKNALALAEAIVLKAEDYRKLGFVHNDFKPENFMFKPRPDGSFSVEFIDWATGGFERSYDVSGKDAPKPEQLFQTLFDCAFTSSESQAKGQTTYQGPKGRFLTIQGKKITYGINPSLEILHGRRNCTLPYIAPNKVLGRDTNTNDFLRSPSAFGKTNAKYDTLLSANDTAMDDWALTALTFGVCNRKAYLTLAKGRTLSDYKVPGVLEPRGEQLTVADPNKFNEFFAPEVSDAIIDLDNDINNPNAVMYIPSTLREGQPLHLYQRLQQLSLDPELESDLKHKIRTVLDTVHRAVANGVGLSQQDLKQQLSIATECLHAITQQQHTQQMKQEHIILQEALRAEPAQLLQPAASLPEQKNIEILCTYPREAADKDKVNAILEALPSTWFQNNILKDNHAPVRDLLPIAIARNQSDILSVLLKKMTPDSKFIDLVRTQGLLIYALQQGMTTTAQDIITALKASNADEQTIFNLMLRTYGPKEQVPYITWNTNAFHAAIRNKNQEQLNLILAYLPTATAKTPYPEARQAVKDALYFSADLLNKDFFDRILTQYNKKNPSAPITTREILTMRDETTGACPFHFFLSEPSIPSEPICTELESMLTDTVNKPAVKKFLMEYPYPCIIAAENENYSAALQMLHLSAASKLLPEESRELLQQTNQQGENLLNHFLLSGNFETIQGFISLSTQYYGMTQDVLHALLINPQPNNPLKQFLSSATVSNNDKYNVLTLLVDEIGDNTEQSIQQRRLRNILVANSDWLLEQANTRSNHHQLSELLSHDKLSRAAKLSLLEHLITESQPSTIARTYYSDLLKALTPSPTKPGQATEALDIQPEDMIEIQQQKGDLHQLINDLLANSGARWEKLIAAKQQELDALKTEKMSLIRTIEDLNRAKDDWQRDAKTAQAELIKIVKERDDTKQDLRQLITKMEETEVTYADKVALLEQEFQGTKTQLQQEKATLKETHAAALQEIQNKIEDVQNQYSEKARQATGLEDQLLSLTEQYTNAQRAVEELTAQVQVNEKTQLAAAEDHEILANRVVALDAELVSLQQKFDTASQSAATLEDQLAEKEHALQELESSSKATTQEHQRLNDDIAELKEQIQGHQASIADVTHALGLANDKFAILNSDYHNLTVTNSTLEQTINSLKTSLDTTTERAQNRELELTLQISSMQEVTHELELKVQTVTTQLTEAQETTVALRDDLDRVNHLLSAEHDKSRSNDNTIVALEQQRNELNTQLEEAVQSVHILTHQINALQQTNEQLINTFSGQETDLHHRIEAMQTQLRNQELASTALIRQLDEEKAKSDKLSFELEQLGGQVNDLEEQLNLSSQKATTLEKQLAQKELVLQQLEQANQETTRETAQTQQDLCDDIAHLKEEIQVHQNRIAQVTHELNKTNTSLELLRIDYNDLTFKNSTLEQTISTLETKLNATTKSASDRDLALNQQILSLKEIIQNLEFGVENVSAELTTERRTITTLRTELNEINHLLREEQNKSQSNEVTIETLIRQREKSEEKLIESEQNVRTLTNEITTLEKRNEQLMGQSSSKELDFLSQLKTIQDELAQKKLESTHLTQQLAAEKAETQRLTVNVDQLERQVTLIQNKFDTASQKAASLEEQLAKKEHALQQLENSTQEITQKTKKDHQDLSNDIAQLKAQIQAHQATIEEVTHELEEANAKFDRLNSDYQSLTFKNSTLEHAIGALHDELKTTTQSAQERETELNLKILSLEENVRLFALEVVQVTAQLIAEQNNTIVLHNERNLIQGLLDKERTRSQQNNEKITELEEQHAALNEQLEDTKDNVQRLQHTIATLEQNNEQLKTEASKQESELLSQIEAMQNNLAKKQDAASNLIEQLTTAQQDNERLHDDLSEAKSNIGDLQHEVSQLTQDIGTITQEYQNATTEIHQLQEELKTSKRDLEESIAAQSNVRETLNSSKSDNQLLNEELQVLQEYHKGLTARHEDLLKLYEASQSTNNDLLKALHALKEKQTELFREYDSQDKENTDVKQALETALAQITQLTQHVQELENVIQDKDLEIANLQGLIDVRNERIQQLEESCEALQQQIRAQAATAISSNDLSIVQAQVAHYKKLFEASQQEVDLLNQENTILRKDADRNQSIYAKYSSSAQRRGHHTTHHRKKSARSTRSILYDTDESSDHGYDRDDSSSASGSQRTEHYETDDSDEELKVSRGDAHRLQARRNSHDFSDTTSGESNARKHLLFNSGRHRGGAGSGPGYDSESDDGYGKGHRKHGRGYDSDDSSDAGSVAPPPHRRSSTTSTAKGSLPAMTASATRAELEIRGARTLEDVQADINIAIGATPATPNPIYTNTIQKDPQTNEDKFVRLANVDPGTTNPPRKLLDATVDKVTVYKRFTDSPSLTVERKARIILKSMGVPPEPGFDFPTELVINSKTSAADFVDNGKNTALVAVIHKVFEIYDEEKRLDDDLNAGIPATPRR